MSRIDHAYTRHMQGDLREAEALYGAMIDDGEDIVSAANNLFLVLDLVIWPQPNVDLRLPRLLLALAAGLSLIWGFIWDLERD